MPGMIAPLVHLSSRPDLEVTRLADALSDVLRAGSSIQSCSPFSDGISGKRSCIPLAHIYSAECRCLHCAGASPNLRLNARLNASSDS